MVRGSVAFVRQTPWIFNGTIRENILCGREYDSHKYHSVLSSCCLLPDMDQFARGDATEVGDRGNKLSGGQRARINLARAAYSSADVYLLDDPLSSVDVHVARHIMEHCILGQLRDKTRILVTHLESLVEEFNIPKIRINGGKIAIESVDEKKDDSPVASGKLSFNMTNEIAVESERVAGAIAKHTQVSREEKRKSGTIEAKNLYIYCRAMGVRSTVIILLSLLLMQASRNANDWWLSSWTANASDTKRSQSTFMTGLAVIAAFNSCIALLRSFSFAYGGLCAADSFFERLLKRITASRIEFFDANSIGRVMVCNDVESVVNFSN
jgi:ATP-binding cassette, subfamily C (CFTR/MRP), member 10